MICMVSIAIHMATGTAKAMTRLLEPRRGTAQSITFDNGSEFAEHREVAKLNKRPRKRLEYRTPAQVFLG